MGKYRDDPEALERLVEADRVHRDVYTDPEMKSPLAYSQKPASRCLHVLQESEIEKRDDERREFFARTPFLYTETKGDESQRHAATAWHTLVWRDGRLRIRLKRVDLLNCDAALPSIQLFL